MSLETGYNIKVVGSIDRGLPSPFGSWNYWPVLKRVWVPCIPLSVVSYAITYSVGKSFAMKYEYEIDSSQELIALGGSNLFSSFFQCIPVGASLSRSAVQDSSGGRTQLVSLVNCVGILAVLLYFGSLLEQLPDVSTELDCFLTRFFSLLVFIAFSYGFLGSPGNYHISSLEGTPV